MSGIDEGMLPDHVQPQRADDGTAQKGDDPPTAQEQKPTEADGAQGPDAASGTTQGDEKSPRTHD